MTPWRRPHGQRASPRSSYMREKILLAFAHGTVAVALMRGRVRQRRPAAPRRARSPAAVAPRPPSPTRPCTHKAAAQAPSGALARAACNSAVRRRKRRRRKSRDVREWERLVVGGPRLRPCLRSRRLLPRSASFGATPGYGSSSIRKRPQVHSRRCNDHVSILRSGAMAAPGVIVCIAPHFGCLLRHSRNSWNSSWVAAGGLPATPSCCFMKSWNFARSSGSCAFRSSHS
jgi:hypothetical protein